MSQDETLPPSLAAKPNIPWEEQTLEQLQAEYAYWDDKLMANTEWGAAIGFAGNARAACERWIERRMREAKAQDAEAEALAQTQAQPS